MMFLANEAWAHLHKEQDVDLRNRGASEYETKSLLLAIVSRQIHQILYQPSLKAAQALTHLAIPTMSPSSLIGGTTTWLPSTPPPGWATIE